jgi:hypothetical protein
MMRSRWLILTLLLGWGLSWCAAWSSWAEEVSPAQDVAQIIRRLGSTKFVEREQATHALDALGTSALSALREAVQSDDIEVSRRAEVLIKKIEQRTERDRILAATPVHLKYQARPVAEAVADLAKRTGYAILLKDEGRKLAGRTVTVDTGPTSFWQALEQFCEAAGLVELGGTNLRLPTVQVPRALPVPKAAVGIASRTSAAVAGKGLIVLGDGKVDSIATYHVGSIRFRIAPVPTRRLGDDAGTGPIPLLLEVAPEPRHESFALTEARLEQVVDDDGQQLSSAPAAGNVAGPARASNVRLASFQAASQRLGGGQQLPIWITAPERKPKALKEIHGWISAQVQLGPQPLLGVDNILQAAGQLTKGAEGGYLKVLEVARLDDGQVRVRAEMQAPPQVIPGVGPQGLGAGVVLPIQAAQIQLLPAGQPVPMTIPVAPGRPAGALPFAGWSYLGLSLLDDKGKAFNRPSVLQQQTRANGPIVTRDVTLLFKPVVDQGKARKLVFSGSRSVTLEVPFTFQNVTLP